MKNTLDDAIRKVSTLRLCIKLLETSFIVYFVWLEGRGDTFVIQN